MSEPVELFSDAALAKAIREKLISVADDMTKLKKRNVDVTFSIADPTNMGRFTLIDFRARRIEDLVI